MPWMLLLWWLLTLRSRMVWRGPPPKPVRRVLAQRFPFLAAPPAVGFGARWRHPICRCGGIKSCTHLRKFVECFEIAERPPWHAAGDAGAARNRDIGMKDAALDLGAVFDRHGGGEDAAVQAPCDDDFARDDIAFDSAIGGDHQAARGNAAYDPAGHHNLAIDFEHARDRHAVTQERRRFLSFKLRYIVPRARCRGSTGHCQHEHPMFTSRLPSREHHGPERRGWASI